MKGTIAFCILVATALQLIQGFSLDVITGSTYCTDKADGIYGNAYNCQYFYECRDFATKIGRCDKSLEFDVKTKSCETEKVVQCTAVQTECVIDCSGHNHGALFPNPEDCGSFYQCSWGVAHLHQCPVGTVFNPAIKVCDWPGNVDCGNKRTFCGGGNTTTTEKPSSTVLPTTEAPTTVRPTTQRPTTQQPTSTQRPTTQKPTSTQRPTTQKPTSTQRPTTQKPTTQKPTKPPQSSESDSSESSESNSREA